MKVYVFENREEAMNLEPIALTRPAFDLRCGAFTFLERIQRLLPGSTAAAFVREELVGLARERFRDLEVAPDSVGGGLWLNGTVLWSREILDGMKTATNTLFFSSEKLVGAVLDEGLGNRWLKNGGPVDTLPDGSATSQEVSVDSVRYLWDCVNINAKAIERDSDQFSLGEIRGEVDEGAYLKNRRHIWVGKGSRVEAGAVLDATDGPILLGDNAAVLSNAYLQGPMVVGEKSIVKVGAKIYGETSIGPGCKMGGEVEETIVQSWSNKQHDGFIGHAYIGEWVNIGADTNNSDLKNNYSSVTVTVNGRLIDTGSLFVGLFLGDHCKTGINTMFNTGTSVGPGSNIVGYGFPPKAISPFSWVVDGEIAVHRFDKFLQTARAVKERRGQSISVQEEALFQQLFSNRSQSPSR